MRRKANAVPGPGRKPEPGHHLRPAPCHRPPPGREARWLGGPAKPGGFRAPRRQPDNTLIGPTHTPPHADQETFPHFRLSLLPLSGATRTSAARRPARAFPQRGRQAPCSDDTKAADFENVKSEMPLAPARPEMEERARGAGAYRTGTS